MNRLCLVIFLAGLASHATSAYAQDAQHGEQAYKLCASCHGFKGEGNVVVNAPSVAGQEPWYLARQIGNFRAGIRGDSAEDATGYSMARMTGAIKSDKDVDDLVAYIGTLPAPQAESTLGGNADKGKALYTACAACHGQKAEGNAALNAPGLAGLQDWYQVAQLGKFKSGQRGAHPGDTYGRQMAPMASMLADEAAMRDVAAYVNTLQ